MYFKDAAHECWLQFLKLSDTSLVTLKH